MSKFLHDTATAARYHHRRQDYDNTLTKIAELINVSSAAVALSSLRVKTKLVIQM